MEDRDRWQHYVDEIIQKAVEQGEFDYSSLKGKKLRESSTEVFEGDRAMAHKMLKNSGYAPDFIMKKREIDEMLDKQRSLLLRYALRRRRLLAAAEAASEESAQEGLRQQAEADWQWAVRQVEAALPKINEQISIFNLINKIPNMHKRRIHIEKEIERVEQELAEAEQ